MRANFPHELKVQKEWPAKCAEIEGLCRTYGALFLFNPFPALGFPQLLALSQCRDNTFLCLFGCGGCFNDFYFFRCEVVQVIDETVNLRFCGGDLAFERGFLLRRFGS
jgi:hypothetical protein